MRGDDPGWEPVPDVNGCMQGVMFCLFCTLVVFCVIVLAVVFRVI